MAATKHKREEDNMARDLTVASVPFNYSSGSTYTKGREALFAFMKAHKIKTAGVMTEAQAVRMLPWVTLKDGAEGFTLTPWENSKGETVTDRIVYPLSAFEGLDPRVDITPLIAKLPPLKKKAAKVDSTVKVSHVTPTKAKAGAAKAKATADTLTKADDAPDKGAITLALINAGKTADEIKEVLALL